jgi:hypothetical protein
MTYTVSHDKAANGREVGTTVELVNAENLSLAQWVAKVTVDYRELARTHHQLRSLAERWASNMRKTQLYANRH